MDLVLRHRGRLFGVECKRTDTPRLTPSIRHSLDDLKLERVWIVYPGERRLRLHKRVEALPLAALATPEPDLLPKRARHFFGIKEDNNMQEAFHGHCVPPNPAQAPWTVDCIPD